MWIPTEDEWYKAAYYSQAINLGLGGYYQANQNYLTDVGAFSASASYYGTFDQSGNVSQWNDLDGTGSSPAGVRGGDWGGAASHLTSSDRSVLPGSFGGNGGVGFRLAGSSSPSGVPEIDPSGLGVVLALVSGVVGLLEQRRSRR